MKTIVLSLAVILATFVGQSANAQSQKGAGCGDKVCKLVRTTIKKTVICYGCKSEDFCVPGKSCVERKGLHGCSCGTKCGCKGRCSCGSDHKPYCKVCVKVWTPGCATLMTRKKLVKYEKTVVVPGWEWEDVDAKGVGCDCAKASCGCAAMLRRAPQGAVIGQSFPATVEEIRLVSGMSPVGTQPRKAAKKNGFKSIFDSLLK